MSFLAPGKHRLTGGSKDRGQQEPIFIKKLSEFLGNGKTDMMKRVRGKSFSILSIHLSVRTLPQELQKRVLQEWGTIIY